MPVHFFTFGLRLVLLLTLKQKNLKNNLNYTKLSVRCVFFYFNTLVVTLFRFVQGEAGDNGVNFLTRR